ncbi:hypothetical protein ACFXTH_031494 [Malus domestica]
MNQGFPVRRARGEWRRARSSGVSQRGEWRPPLLALTWLRHWVQVDLGREKGREVKRVEEMEDEDEGGEEGGVGGIRGVKREGKIKDFFFF